MRSPPSLFSAACLPPPGCSTPKSYDVAVTSGDDTERREVLEWQSSVQDVLAGEVDVGVTAEGSSGLNVYYFTGRSLDDAVEEAVAGEVFLAVITCESWVPSCSFPGAVVVCGWVRVGTVYGRVDVVWQCR